MSDNIIEIIPACPPVGGHNSKRFRDAVAENTDLSVRGRAGSTVERPAAPPVDELVPTPPPTPRRNFGPAPVGYAQRPTRKGD
jgi:hypothetical protein